MPINSHKQLPHLIMKRFSHSNELISGMAVFVLPFREMYLPTTEKTLEAYVVSEESIDELGTQFGYYDDDVEREILSRKVESPFGTFVDKLLKIAAKDIDGIDENALIQLFEKNREIVVKFLDYNLFRNGKTTERISVGRLNIPEIVIQVWKNNKNIDISKINQLQTLEEQLVEIKKLTGKDYSEKYSQNGAIRHIEQMGRNWHNRFNIGLLINQTEADLITRKACNFSVKTKEGKEHIIVPLCTKIALFLYEKTNDVNEPLTIQVITKRELIDTCNKRCIISEIEMDKEFCIAKDRATLDALLEFVKSNSP